MSPRRFAAFALLLCGFAAQAAPDSNRTAGTTAGTTAAARHVLGVRGRVLTLDGRPVQLFGARVAAAALSDALERELLAALPEYARYGVNAITVFYQGCDALKANPFSADGARFADVAVRDRMDRIIAAADSLGVVVVVGVFYKNAPRTLRDAAAIERAVRLVAGHLRAGGRRNTIVNIANENTIFSRVKQPYRALADPATIARLCAAVHAVNPAQLVGGGGFSDSANVAIGRAAAADVLLFDKGGCAASSGALYDRYAAAGVRKPMLNVELLTTHSKTRPPGCYDSPIPAGSCPKAAYTRHVDETAARPGLGVFLHTQSWYQLKGAPRYRLGGMGACAGPAGAGDAGVRWWFEHVRRLKSKKKPASPAG